MKIPDWIEKLQATETRACQSCGAEVKQGATLYRVKATDLVDTTDLCQGCGEFEIGADAWRPGLTPA